ncbi:TIGR04211 family SH3 domain-containing protein [Alteromonas sp. CYL-A6]|uniref:TIGR04211 family SH3 domain-containing protein n=1 Tax=Alteromonas nitratireducens TaxID=3390813 RepID=UPI0034C1EAEE
MRTWLALAILLLPLPALSVQDTAAPADEPSHFVRDDLFIFMHAGPSREYRILGSVNAGTPLNVQERDGDFTKVVADGRTGWVETRFISTTLPVSLQLPEINQQLADREVALQQASNSNAQLRQQLNDARQQIAELTSQAETQQQTIATLQQQVKREDKDELFTWFTRGGMVAGGGVVLGLLLSFLPRKRRRGGEWM